MQDALNAEARMPFTLTEDAAGLNQALYEVTHGLYVLTAASGGRLNGQCLDALMQVTSTPPRVAIGVNVRSLTHEMIERSGAFVVNVLDRGDPAVQETIRRFGFQSGRTVDKFAGFPHEVGANGAPILPTAKAFYECRVVPGMRFDLGTHTLFVASVERGGTRPEGEPLTYNEYRKTMRRRTG